MGVSPLFVLLRKKGPAALHAELERTLFECNGCLIRAAQTHGVSRWTMIRLMRASGAPILNQEVKSIIRSKFRLHKQSC